MNNLVFPRLRIFPRIDGVVINTCPSHTCALSDQVSGLERVVINKILFLGRLYGNLFHIARHLIADSGNDRRHGNSSPKESKSPQSGVVSAIARNIHLSPKSSWRGRFFVCGLHSNALACPLLPASPGVALGRRAAIASI